jgi:ankyrin repeat protein
MSPTIFSDCVIAGQSHIVTHLRTVTGIIEAKAQAMAAKASGQSRLHIACSTGHLDIVLCLLNHGADVHARDKNGVTPLHSACQIGSLEVIEALLSCGSDIDSQTYEGQETGLVVAASLGHVSCVDFLIKNKADVSLSRSHNFLPLHEAASRGHTEVARLLLDAGNDVNAAPNSGWTALHAAAYYGYPDLGGLQEQGHDS